MKRIFRLFLLATIIFVVLINTVSCAREKPLRLHIRANSNLTCDQDVKLSVRDEVIKYLTPILKNARSVNEAKTLIKENSSAVEKLCDETLREHGFFYGAELKIDEEYFPSRTYGELTLEAGVYEAVIINLGSGEGNNWWCVAYPPLCFGTDEKDIEYRSAIFDWISRSKNE